MTWETQIQLMSPSVRTDIHTFRSHNNVGTDRQLTIVRGGLGKHIQSSLLNSAHSCISTILSVDWFNVICAEKDIFALEWKF